MTTSKMTASGKVVFFLIANLYHVELLLGCGYLLASNKPLQGMAPTSLRITLKMLSFKLSVKLAASFLSFNTI